MNKLKISKLLSAADAFYKKAGGEPKDLASAQNLANSRIQSINAINLNQWSLDQVQEQVAEQTNRAKLDWDSNLINSEQYQAVIQAGVKKNEAAAAKANQPSPAPSKPVPAKSRYQRIDPVFQTMLGVNPDGSLGPITQGALDLYKKSIGQAGASNELAFEALKREPQYTSKKEIPFDDNANVYLVTREKTVTNSPVENAGKPVKTWGV